MSKTNLSKDEISYDKVFAYYKEKKWEISSLKNLCLAFKNAIKTFIMITVSIYDEDTLFLCSNPILGPFNDLFCNVCK